jgi:N-acetylglutamate synthase-like GNAT family acetyltransferase
MSGNAHSQAVEGLVVRSYEPADHHSVAHLYSHGLLAGQIAPNDTGADIENVEAAYFDQDCHHFWVAEVEGQVVGMIGVASDEPHTAEIRRLRVAEPYQETEIPGTLLETAINHCKHHDYLKVRLDTRFERDAALSLFDRVGFQHTRSKNLHGKELLEFYLDLYRDPDAPRSREAE